MEIDLRIHHDVIESQTCALPDNHREELPEELPHDLETFLTGLHPVLLSGVPHKEIHHVEPLLMGSVLDVDGSVGGIIDTHQGCGIEGRMQRVLETVKTRHGAEPEPLASGEAVDLGEPPEEGYGVKVSVHRWRCQVMGRR